MLQLYEVVSLALEGVKPPGPKISQAILASRLQCCQRAVGAYLFGRSLPPTTRIPQYAAVLGVDEVELGKIIAADRKLGYAKLARLAAAHNRRRAVSA